jgi:hypothetical protein
VDPSGTCLACAAALPKGYDATCVRCGWDDRVGMRKCVACKGPIVLHEALGFGPIGSIVGVGGFAAWMFLRAVGLAGICVIGAICGVISAFFMTWRCSLCKKRPRRDCFNPEEKRTFRLRRLGFVLGAVLLVAGAAVSLVVGLAPLAARHY